MPTPLNAYSLNTIADLITLNGTVNQETITVLGYYSTNDGGGGDFYWDAGNTDAANGGTIFQGATPSAGRWKRVFDNVVDVKWFGAKGDAVQDDRPFIQNALNFIASFSSTHNYALYISKGNYKITSPPSGDALLLNVPNYKNIDIYGDGSSLSILTYVPDFETANTECHVFKIAGNPGPVTSIRDFAIIGSEGHQVGKGLSLQRCTIVNVENIKIMFFNTGINLEDILDCNFLNCYVGWNHTGVIGYGVGTTRLPPNLLNFTSCYIGSNDTYGLNLGNGHSTTVLACSFEDNGKQDNMSTGAVYYYFIGENGANGLNVTNSYFEGNKGRADINIETYPNTYGTHTFIGNTFNRINAGAFTINNIHIASSGQSPKPNFGFNASKVMFQGNGFLVSGTYGASAARKTIELNSPNYWDFDIVEQGNVYSGVIDAPTFNTSTPQTSENTRVKAFARLDADGSIRTSYNIRACEVLSDNSYMIYFANDLSNLYTTSLTLVGQTGFMFTALELSTGVQVVVQNTSGTFVPGRFSIVVF